MATQETAQEALGSPSTEKTILFVDDERPLLELYEQLFGETYTVLTAERGQEALDRFGEHVDVAFFDRRLPDVSGIEVIRTLKAEGYETPMGIISAVEPETDLDANHEVYLTKPTDPDTIRDTIAEQTA